MILTQPCPIEVVDDDAGDLTVVHTRLRVVAPRRNLGAYPTVFRHDAAPQQQVAQHLGEQSGFTHGGSTNVASQR